MRLLPICLLLLGASLSPAGEPPSPDKPKLEKPVPAPPPPSIPRPAVEVKKPPAVEKLTELERLLALVKLMRQRLMLSSETAFYIGQRHLKILHFTTPLYDVAKKWADIYRKAIRKMVGLPLTEVLCKPELLAELRDAIEWGKLRAIGEPWYYKKGYRRAQPLLERGDVPDCLWVELPPR